MESESKVVVNVIIVFLLAFLMQGCKKKWQCSWQYHSVWFTKGVDTFGTSYTGKQEYIDSIKQQYLNAGYTIIQEKTSWSPTNPPEFSYKDCDIVKALEKNGSVCIEVK